MNEQGVTGEVTAPFALDAYAEAGPVTVQESVDLCPVTVLDQRESTWLARAVRREQRAQKSYLQKVHGRSKYVVHQGARERARRLRQRQAYDDRCAALWIVGPASPQEAV